MFGIESTLLYTVSSFSSNDLRCFPIGFTKNKYFQYFLSLLSLENCENMSMVTSFGNNPNDGSRTILDNEDCSLFFSLNYETSRKERGTPTNGLEIGSHQNAALRESDKPKIDPFF